MRVKTNFKNLLLVLSLVLLYTTSTTAQNEIPSIAIKKNVAVPMSDGVILRADVFLPPNHKGKKFPVVLVRLPYNKRGFGIIGKHFAAKDYIVVLQDVRGKYASEGVFRFLADEKKDGLETLDWITRQGWCDGNIGMMGPSYLSYCGLILASEDHPALKTVINSSGLTDIYSLMHWNGSINFMIAFTWLAIYEHHAQRSLKGLKLKELFKTMPLKNMMKKVKGYHGTWNTITKHPHNDAYYKNLSVNPARIKIPILHFTGWNDWMHYQTLDVYQQIQKHNSQQKMMIGAWTHNQDLNGGSKFGEEDFGKGSELGIKKYLAMSKRWFDYHLKAKKNGVMDEPAVTYFLMNENKWQTAKGYPVPNAKEMSWYLQSKGQANTLNGDGVLSTRKPGRKSKVDKFVYDPANPVPTTGGLNVHFFRKDNGIKDQRKVEERSDVLVYTSKPLTKPLKIVGEVKMKLFVASDAVDTDFTVKLVEVRKDGYARIIQDGVAKTRFRNGYTKVEKITPGKVYGLDVVVGTTAISIPKGSKLRVEVSSSNFPKIPRNANTGISETHAKKFKKANQQIFHSKAYPSRLILPIVE